jgi:hypothetical protein
MTKLDSSIADIIKQKFPKTAEAENIHEPLEDNKMEKDFVLSSQKNLFNTVMHGSFCAPFKDSQETNMPSDPWLRLKM